ncbi:MAG TPA: hypothetical protein VGK30_13595 [Candidatus Binatia bacterium]|jgi:hypothetical protein
MSNRRDSERPKAEAEIEREIRQGRAFSLGDAIARAAGPGALKGESPVSRVQQAETEIKTWLRSHLADGGGPLEVVLHRYVTTSELMLENLEQPLVALAACCRRVLESEGLLKELVRNVDLEWGRIMGERPHFEKEGIPPRADDPYTIDLVRNVLSRVREQLAPSKE